MRQLNSKLNMHYCKNQKVDFKKEIKYSNYPLFLCQQGFKKNPTGEIIFQQKDKVYCFQAFILTLSTLSHTVLNLPTVESSAEEWCSALEFNYLSKLLFLEATPQQELRLSQSNVENPKKIYFLVLSISLHIWKPAWPWSAVKLFRQRQRQKLELNCYNTE